MREGHLLADCEEVANVLHLLENQISGVHFLNNGWRGRRLVMGGR